MIEETNKMFYEKILKFNSNSKIKPTDKFKTSDEKSIESVQGVQQLLPTNKLFPDKILPKFKE